MGLKKLILAGALIASSVAGQISKTIDYDYSQNQFIFLNEQTSSSSRVLYSEEEDRGLFKFENKQGELPLGMNYSDVYDSTSQTKKIEVSNENLGVTMNESSVTGSVARTFGYFVSGKYQGLELKTSVLPSGELVYSTAYPLSEQERLNFIVEKSETGELERGIGFKTEDRSLLKNLEFQVLQVPSEAKEQNYNFSAKTTLADDKNVLPSLGLEYITGTEWSDVACSVKYKNWGVETSYGENKVQDLKRDSVSASAYFLNNSLQLRTIFRTDETGRSESLNFIQYKREF